jgi:hypothetical protein
VQEMLKALPPPSIVDPPPRKELQTFGDYPSRPGRIIIPYVQDGHQCITSRLCLATDSISGGWFAKCGI